MKKLIAGLGVLLFAMPAAQATAKSHTSADDLRTKRANLQKPIVRVKHHSIAVEPCQCQVPHQTFQQHQRVSKPQATGWQRTAKVVPYLRQAPRQTLNNSAFATKVKPTTRTSV